MTTKDKYQEVIELGKQLNIKDDYVKEESDVLKMKGTFKTQYEKNILWDKIKEIGDQEPSDILANIIVEDNSVFHRHVVKSGETLGKIAKHYYGNAMRYPEIFEANKPMLDHPDKIYPGQVLRIPNAE